MLPLNDRELPFIEPPGPDEVEIPEQKQHFDLPVRFGAVPVDKEPLGWQVETRRRSSRSPNFRTLFRRFGCLFRKFSAPSSGTTKSFWRRTKKDFKLRELSRRAANRLFFGDNLHIMRQLPSNSIDLFYIDPPFSPVVTTMSFSATKTRCAPSRTLGRRDARLLGLAKRATL